MNESSAGKANPPGGKKSTETTHIRVKDNELKEVKTSDGSAQSGIITAY